MPNDDAETDPNPGNQLTVSRSAAARVPILDHAAVGIIADAGERAARRFLE